MRVVHPFRAAAVAAALAWAVPVHARAQANETWYPYAAPQVISSDPATHFLNATVKTAPSVVTLNGVRYPANLYAGTLFPPVLKLEPGDSMRVLLVNAMDTTAGQLTNLHFHGFAVSPVQPSDDVVHIHVPRDSSYTYRIHLPADHAQGLFWYHPHSHGDSYNQVKAGMSGAISIGDPRRSFPEFLHTPEIYLLLKFFQPDNATEITTVNGVPRVELPQMRQGEAQFWRVGNITAERYYRLRLVGPAGDSVPFQVLARDGNVVADGPPVMTDLVLLGAGQRLEMVVQGTQPGYYTLVATDFLRQSSVPDPRNPQLVDSAAVLARVKVNAVPNYRAAVAAARRGGNAAEARVIRAITAPTGPVVRDSVDFEVVRSDSLPVSYPIDHAVYDADSIVKRFALGTTYVWRITNSSQSWHTFHIHQTDFVVDSVGGEAKSPDYRLDTVSVPPCTQFEADKVTCSPGHKGVAVIRFLYDHEYLAGEFVFHCHMLFHQDNGMMANVLLGPPGAAHAHRH